MRCPLCQENIGEGEDLQFHYLLGCSAYTAGRTPEDDENETVWVGVRFRWAKVTPCVERIVHVISSLAGSIPLHWSDIEGLYESALTSVPVGTHSCQLAIGGNVVPVQDFDIERDTDVMYIVPIEEDDDDDNDGDALNTHEIVDEHDDPVAELLASQSYQRDEPHTTVGGLDRHDDDDNGDGDGDGDDDDDDRITDIFPDGSHGNPIELSPLYKELLQHQVLHGEPSWIPSSGNQSPTSSDQEIEDIIRETRAELEPPLLTGQPAVPDDRLLKSPIPVKPIEIVELPDKTMKPLEIVELPEKTEDIHDKTSETKAKDELASSSSGTFSGSSSKGSSDHGDQQQSPPVESDSSDGDLQEQSLEESIPQIDELPCPYSGTFITSSDNVPSPTAPIDNAPTSDDPPVIGYESSTCASSLEQSVRPGQLETRASPPDGKGTVVDQSETSASLPNEKLGVETGQTRTDQPLHERPPSTGSLDQLETRTSPHDSGASNQSASRASPQVHPGSARSSQSEPRVSPYARPDSARSNQSETRASLTDPTRDRPAIAGSTSQSGIRASPFDPLAARTPQDRPSSVQSDTRASPTARPSSARSSQSERRASPRDHSTIDQLETRASLHGRPFSARSSQSEPRPSPPYQPSPEHIMRRYSGPSGFSGLSQNILTSPLTDFRTAHIERGASISSHRSRTSPREEPPSPSEPSPSISQRSSARSSLQDTRLLPDRPPDGLPVELAHRSVLSHGTENGLPVDHTLPRDRPSHVIDSRTLHQQPNRSAFAPTTARTGTADRHRNERTSIRHKDDVPGASEDLMVVGHSIAGLADRGLNGDERRPGSHREKLEESFAEELSKRTAAYEQEINELKALNEELCQQLMSLEAAAALTEQDVKSSKSLERMVKTLTGKLQEREKEIDELKIRVAELEKENQEMKDEQESLRTVNKLTYEDLNKVNSDLLAERTSELRRKTYGSPVRPSAQDNIPQIEAMNQTLRDKVNRLETEKRDLKSKYNDTKIELEKTIAEKNISEFRLTRAKSEADLAEKFNRFTEYRPTTDKELGLTNHKTTDSSGLGSSRYTWSDTNIDAAYKIGSHVTPSHTLVNGSTREHTRRDNPAGYGSSRTFRGTLDNGLDRQTARTRHRSLSSESSGSSLLEYEYGANIRIPYETTSYRSRDDKVELRGTGSGRKARPHSYDGSRPLTDYITDDYKHHPKSSTYTAPLYQDYSSTKPYDYTRSSLNSSFNSDSSYGTTPYMTTGKTRDYSKPILPNSSRDVRIGKRVVVTRTCGNVGRGVVRYVGTLPNRTGSYVGVELDYPQGKHDGSIEGKQLFKCKPNRGIFVKFEKVIMCYN